MVAKSPAIRRYLARMLALMTLYLILLFGAVWTFRHGPPLGLLAWPLAIAPAIPVLGTFWAIMRLLVEEKDEYQRMLLVKQALFATAFCLTITTIWQFLQDFDLVAAGNGGFGAAFFWFVGFGLGAAVNRLSGDSATC